MCLNIWILTHIINFLSFFFFSYFPPVLPVSTPQSIGRICNESLLCPVESGGRVALGGGSAAVTHGTRAGRGAAHGPGLLPLLRAAVHARAGAQNTHADLRGRRLTWRVTAPHLTLSLYSFIHCVIFIIHLQANNDETASPLATHTHLSARVLSRDVSRHVGTTGELTVTSYLTIIFLLIMQRLIWKWGKDIRYSHYNNIECHGEKTMCSLITHLHNHCNTSQT